MKLQLLARYILNAGGKCINRPVLCVGVYVWTHTGDVALHDGHSVGGQCSSLVRADRRSVAHRLTGVQVSYQVIVVHHFLHSTRTRHNVTQRKVSVQRNVPYRSLIS